MKILERIQEKASNSLKKVVFPEGEDERTIQAAKICFDKKLVVPVLLGGKEKIAAAAGKLNIDLSGIEVRQPDIDPSLEEFSTTDRKSVV